MSFRLIPKSVTLNDLEWRYFALFVQIQVALHRSSRSLSHLLMSSCTYLVTCVLTAFLLTSCLRLCICSEYSSCGCYKGLHWDFVIPRCSQSGRHVHLHRLCWTRRGWSCLVLVRRRMNRYVVLLFAHCMFYRSWNRKAFGDRSGRLVWAPYLRMAGRGRQPACMAAAGAVQAGLAAAVCATLTGATGCTTLVSNTQKATVSQKKLEMTLNYPKCCRFLLTYERPPTFELCIKQSCVSCSFFILFKETL